MQTKQNKRRMAYWVLAGIIGGAVPAIAPLPAMAADEFKELAADKAPPAVVASVKAESPDGRGRRVQQA